MDTLAVTRSVLRQELCTRCARSTNPRGGAEASDGKGLRPCEAECDIFYYLPRLAAMVRRFGGEPPCGYALAVLNLPSRACGDRRPLNDYAEAAMALIETMNQGR